jgi:uncharacterized membrane protein
MIAYLVLLILFFLIAPFYLDKFAKNTKVGQVLGGIVVCYFIGIALGNTQALCISEKENLDWLNNISTQLFTFCVLVSIPMFLITTSVKDLFRNIAPVALSFFLIATSVVLVSIGVSYWYKGAIAEGNLATGMLAAVYIGGSPNLVAVGTTLKASPSLMATIELTDVVCSSVYLIFMTSVAKLVLSYILPAYPVFNKTNNSADIEQNEPVSTDLNQLNNQILDDNIAEVIKPTHSFMDYVKGITLSVLIGIGLVAIGLGLATLIPDAQGEPNQIVLMTWLSISALSLSTIKWFRTILGTELAANYIMLIFALSAGSVIDLALLIEKGKDYLGFNACIMLGAFGLHLILAKLFRVNVDTFLVGSVASFFGPGFIPQICIAIKNKKLLPAGVAAGVLGLIIATYIGLGISMFTKPWY